LIATITTIAIIIAIMIIIKDLAKVEFIMEEEFSFATSLNIIAINSIMPVADSC